MKSIDNVATAVQLMDKHLREELLIKDGTLQVKKLWENTYIKKQIDKRMNCGTFTIHDHIRAMVYSMLSSGASWNRVEPGIDINTGQITHIDEIFYQYDVDTLLNADPMMLVEKIKRQTLGTQYTKNQMYALIEDNIPQMLSLEKEYGSIDNFYQHFINADTSLRTLILILSGNDSKYKYAQMGEALIAEYLRNVGYDIAKPDRHIRRILGSKVLGCSNSEITPINEAFELVAEIAKVTGKQIAEVDYILWSYCANGYGDICTVKRPRCAVCVAHKLCYHFYSEEN